MGAVWSSLTMELYIIFIFLLISHITYSHTNVIITPHTAYLKSSLSLTQAYAGLSQANSTIANLVHDYLDHPDISYETKKLVEIVIKTGTAKMERILRKMRLLDENSPGRRKRNTKNPLYEIGTMADWAFGLTSHERFLKMNDSIENTLGVLAKDGQEIHKNVRANSKAISESVQTLQEFKQFLEGVKANDDKILKTDRLFLKIVQIKFELDFFLNLLSKFAWKLTEILDQSDMGFPSRYLFSPNYLRSSLMQLNEKFTNLYPVIGSDKVDQYFSLPLSLSSFDGSSFHSILRIPLVDNSDTFSISDRNFHQGFIDLTSFKYRVMMSFSQFKQCSRKNQNHKTLCIFRPCLIKIEYSNFFCFALNKTSFIISTEQNSSITTLCDKQVRTIQVQQSKSYIHLSAPSHCQVQSQQFIIRNIQTPSSTERGTPLISSILSIDRDRIITNSSSVGNQTITVTHQGIPVQLRQTSTRLPGKTAIPAHYEVLIIGGAVLGIVAIVASVCLSFWGMRKIVSRNKRGKDDIVKDENDSGLTDTDEPSISDDIVTLDEKTGPLTEQTAEKFSEHYEKSISDYLPPYKLTDISRPSGSEPNSEHRFHPSSIANEKSQRTPFCGLLELRCENPNENLCKECKEIKNFSNEKAFSDIYLGQKIEENLKNSLRIPYDTPVKIWPQNDGSHQADTLLLQFVMSITYAEHDEMMSCKMMLMREMTESNIDRVYLHRPAQIWHHWLSLYKVN